MDGYSRAARRLSWRDDWNYQLTISQTANGAISGYTTAVSVANPQYFVTWSIDGQFAANVLSYQNERILNQSPPGTTYCVDTVKLKLSASGDSLSGTWTAPACGSGTIKVQGKGPAPVNFRQLGPGVAEANGVLQFVYTWESSSGNVADLTNCEVGEELTYPSSGDVFIWPSPPYLGSSPNPGIKWLPRQPIISVRSLRPLDALKITSYTSDFRVPMCQTRLTLVKPTNMLSRLVRYHHYSYG